MLPRGGGYCVQFDLSEDDLGIAIACDGPVAGLYETGDEVTPQFPQGHDYGCAVFYPCGRVSSSETPTAPPNPAGTMLIGAEDNSASLTLRRAGGPSPDELGSVVLAAVGPTASILLGSDAAAIPVACATQVTANLDALNNAVQAIPEVGAPETIAAIVAVKAAFTVAYNLFVDIADAKTRVDGPAP
jgi:hypothetical protein